MAQDHGLDPALAAELGIDDPELAAAIEASYKVAPPRHEDDDLARALELSRQQLGQDSTAAGSAGPAQGADPPSFLRPPPALDEVGSNAAVDGDSSRGSSRERGLLDESEVLDPQLAAVIEASYAAQTETARAEEEEDMLRQAMEISRKEEERRQNQALREQQEAELQESILMDQMREQEEKRRRLEEEELRAAAEASQRAEMQRQEEEELRRVEAQEARRSNVPPEPAADAPNRVDLQIRSPDGKRARRRFLSSHTLGQVYDYLHVEGFLDTEAYQLVSTMPRKEYKDRDMTLADADLTGQCALMLERLA